VASGQDRSLTPEQRKFAYMPYMPYMHSESLAIHAQATLLFSGDVPNSVAGLSR
jgi:uncharacterized protein (DUF924 family)